MQSSSVEPASVADTAKIAWRPSDRQSIFLSASEDEVLYGGAAGGGKMLDVREPVPTPTGWTTMGAVKEGDTVFGEHGQQTTVTRAYDIVQSPAGYRLTFDDGSCIAACDQHRWLTFDAAELAALTRRSDEWRANRRANRASKVGGKKSAAFTAAVSARNAARSVCVAAPTGSVRTTAQIAATLRTATGRTNHAIPLAKPIDTTDADLPLDPYCLGAWLGDGDTSRGYLTTVDAEVLAQFQLAGFQYERQKVRPHYRIIGLVDSLRAAGVLRNKHVPGNYLRASAAQRLSLLQGLMDTDGTVCDSGAVEFTNTNRDLADAVMELIVSLGWKANMMVGRATLYGKDCGPKYDIKWTPDAHVFRIKRKLDRQRLATRRTTKFRYIVACDRIESTPAMRCISVSNPTGLFLVGRQMIVTHNSDAILIDALGLQQGAIARPSYRAILFRRSFPELRDLIDRSRALYPVAYPGAQYLETSREWQFPSGSKIEFGYCESDSDRFRYQGREYAYVGWDELTLYPSGLPYQFLLTRLRTTDPAIKTYCRATCNPGGVGHEWVREYFRIPDDGSSTRHAEHVGDRVFTRRFIPARLSDNPHLDGTGYRESLMRQSVQTRRALLDGRWDVVEISGAIYAEQLQAAYAEGRITAIPFERGVPVNTFWDLGRNDTTAIWFHQRVGLQHRFIDYYEQSQRQLAHYADYLREKAAARGYSYGTHYLPHDAAVTDISASVGRSREKLLNDMGVRPTKVVDRVRDLMDGIEQTRQSFGAVWIDPESCKEGLKALSNYRYEYSERSGTWHRTPAHTWASNGSDAFRQFAQGYRDETAAPRINYSRDDWRA